MTEKIKLPFGTQFSPNVIKPFSKMIDILKNNQNNDISLLQNEIEKCFYYGDNENSNKLMARNCKSSLISYKIIDNSKTVELTEFGKHLVTINEEKLIYQEMAIHILKHLNGLALIDTLKRMEKNGDKLTNETINQALIDQGYKVQKTSNYAQVMKLWLEKADVLSSKWHVNEEKLNELIGIKTEEIFLYKELSREQFYFLLALCNTGSEYSQSAKDIRNLATASYGISFGEKAFSQKVLNPLSENNLITIKKTTKGRGAKSPLVQLTAKSKKEIVEPMLEQFSNQVGNVLAESYCKTLKELQEEINSEDKYKKGLALEALTIKIMKIIGLNFLYTRYKDHMAGGEVDIILDSTSLMYSRWQVQCKNTKTVSIDQVAKEVGLSHVLKTNCIVMMTTGHLSSDAIKYANTIMQETNLCILILEGNDIKKIVDNPTDIVNILNKQSLKAKKFKMLNNENLNQ